MTLVFLATMDWTHPWRSVRRVALPVAALVVAVSIVHYVEQIYYPAHYPFEVR